MASHLTPEYFSIQRISFASVTERCLCPVAMKQTQIIRPPPPCGHLVWSICGDMLFDLLQLCCTSLFNRHRFRSLVVCSDETVNCCHALFWEKKLLSWQPLQTPHLFSVLIVLSWTLTVNMLAETSVLRVDAFGVFLEHCVVNKVNDGASTPRKIDNGLSFPIVSIVSYCWKIDSELFGNDFITFTSLIST